MSNKITIYPAAALFNGRETSFNSELVEGLEKLDYKTNFPQRDGFEFGNLSESFSGRLEKNQISSAVQNVIYLLDMGFFIPKSDVILANFDEPLDEGVVVETSYAKLAGKFVIGFRTDVRSPYGTVNDNFGGMHFFPAFQSHKFVLHYMSSRTPEERREQMNSLVKKIDKLIIDSEIYPQKFIPEYVMGNPNFSRILKGAKLLFENIEDIHSEKGLEEIVSRYIKNREALM